MGLGILRNWRCLNKRCNHPFTSGVMNPKCPKCGSLKTNWVPGGFNIGKVAKGIDNTVRGLAADYGMTDIPTVDRGEAVKKANWRHNVLKSLAPGADRTLPQNRQNVTENPSSSDWKQRTMHHAMEMHRRGAKDGIAPPPVNFSSHSKMKGGGTATLPKPDGAILKSRTTVEHRYTGRK